MNVRQQRKLLVCAGTLALNACEGEVSTVGEVDRELPAAEGGAGENRASGESCMPEHGRHPESSGFASTEDNIEIGASACASSICLANHFQGRTNCPYGQAAPSANEEPGAPICALPDGRARVAVAVAPQLVERRADD